MSQLKVKIMYGIFGGERLGGKMRKALRSADYTVTGHVEDADIIMAHSAGCFWLPKNPTQKLLLINPPYWPGKSVHERAKARVDVNLHYRQHGFTHRQWFLRNFWGLYYAVRDFRQTRRIIRYAPLFNLEEIIKDRRVILVRNEEDNWLTPETNKLKDLNPNLIIKQVPGEHEDLYFNPERYVSLLQLLQ